MVSSSRHNSRVVEMTTDGVPLYSSVEAKDSRNTLSSSSSSLQHHTSISDDHHSTALDVHSHHQEAMGIERLSFCQQAEEQEKASSSACSKSCQRFGPSSSSTRRSPSSIKTWVFTLLMTTAVAVTTLSWLPSASCAGLGVSQVHHHMSVDELKQVFHVESHDDVPTNYALVDLTSVAKRRRRRKRSADADDGYAAAEDNALDSHPDHLIRLSALGRDVSLTLRHNAEFQERHADVPMLAAESDEKAKAGLSYEKIHSSDLFDIGLPYQDIENQAAVLVHHDPHDESLQLDGVIGDNLVIKPAPISLKKHYYRLKEQEKKEAATTSTATTTTTTTTETSISTEAQKVSSTTSDANRDEYDEYLDGVDEERTGLHVVFEKEKPLGDVPAAGSDYMLMEPDGIPTVPMSSTADAHRRKKRSVPYVIYPEILVIVDYDTYLLHDGDNRAVKKYVVSFWNGVDLRYRSLRDPRIRLSIAGIIISRGRDATPYLEASKVGRDSVDAADALTEMGKYLFVERRLPTYDIAVIITRLDMCRRKDQYSPCNRGTAGFAYVGGACVVNKRLEKVNSVAIVEDTGGFSGIIVAAHEIGHLLGAVHDGTPPPSYLGGPGATKCKWEDGFIMSDLRHTDTGFQWSSCSIAQFHHFLHGDTASCLHNTPHEEETLPRYLPGKLMSLDAQCRKDRGTSACFSDERVCSQLFCFDAKSGYCVSYRPAGEGSPCGDGKFCINGKCVAEDENAISDYNELPEVAERHDGVAIRDVSGFQGSASTVQNNLFPKGTTSAITERSSTVAVSRKFNSPWSNRWTPPTTTKITTTTTTTTTTTEAPVSVQEKTSTVGFRTSSRRFPWWTTRQSTFTTRAAPTTSTTSVSSDSERPASFAGLSLSQSRRENTSPRSTSTRVTPSTTSTTRASTTSLSTFLSSRSKPRWPSPPGANSANWPPSSSKPSEDGGFTKSPVKTTTTSLATTSSLAPTSSSTSAATTRWQPPANSLEQGDTCQDLLTSMAGGLTCREFLKSYGYRYCQHRYIQQKCCASHRAICKS